MTAEQWLRGEDAEPILISLKDGFTATEKKFIVNVQNAEENIFEVNMQTAPRREEDVSLYVVKSIPFLMLRYNSRIPTW